MFGHQKCFFIEYGRLFSEMFLVISGSVRRNWRRRYAASSGCRGVHESCTFFRSRSKFSAEKEPFIAPLRYVTNSACCAHFLAWNLTKSLEESVSNFGFVYLKICENQVRVRQQRRYALKFRELVFLWNAFFVLYTCIPRSLDWTADCVYHRIWFYTRMMWTRVFVSLRLNRCAFIYEPRKMTLIFFSFQNVSYLRVYNLFFELGLRHLPVVNPDNELVGIITRKDLLRYRLRKGQLVESCFGSVIENEDWERCCIRCPSFLNSSLLCKLVAKVLVRYSGWLVFLGLICHGFFI